MSLLRSGSIRRRLLGLSMAISLLTLTIAGGLFVVNDVAMLLRQMARDLEVLAIVVGQNSLAALTFEAPETAAKQLASLRGEYQIRYAALYDEEGHLFAEYRKETEDLVHRPAPPSDGVFLSGAPLNLGTVDVTRTLWLDGQPIGRIHIHARADELVAQMHRYARIAPILLVVTLVLSLLMAWRLQRRVSKPILELAASTRQVSERSDYSVRVSPPGAEDELGVLYHGFNAMLEQIQARDDELVAIRARLEQRVEERTRELNNLLREQRLIVEALPLGVIHLVGRRVLRASTRAAELFATDAADMLGRSTAAFYADPVDYEAVGSEGYRQMATGGIYRTDRVLKRRDGRQFWGRLIGQAIDPADESLGSIWLVDDIDKDKALEDQLRRARETAEAASLAKDSFLANISHDLRTPLNSVLGFVQLLEADRTLTAAQRENARSIRRGGERLLELINQVLDLAKIEADHLELTPVLWDTSELMDELVTMFRPRAAEKGLGLRFEPHPDLPRRLRSDAGRLHQVLANLIDNAVKFTEEGQVVLRASFTDGMLRAEVQDTGPGMQADALELIFEPFSQVGESATQRSGTGLGLAIVKRLVERMGGRVAVDSTPGQGTTFRVQVRADEVVSATPRSAEPAATDVIIGYRRGLDTRPLRVLIADDEPDNRALLKGFLEPLGFAVGEAENGADCVERAARWRPDLILMDLRMPVVDGLAATKALRQRSWGQAIPIVAITAAAFDDDRATSIAAGCNAHLGKPFTRERLLETLRRCLELVWIRDDAPRVEQTSADPSLQALPSMQRDRLLRLVRTGSVTAIGTLADELAQSGCCPALAQRLSSLSAAFDIAGLRRLAQELERVAQRVASNDASP